MPRNKTRRSRSADSSRALREPTVDVHAGDRTHQGGPVTQVLSLQTVTFLFCYRLAMALAMRTAESPDEWWQSAEVAYYMVFGKGHLSWEWKEGIRSVVYPSFYALPFYVLKLLGLDNVWTVYLAERLVQVCIAVGIDLAIVALARRVDEAIAEDNRQTNSRSAAETRQWRGHRWGVSPSVAQTAQRLSLVLWYMMYNGLRSYSNTAEALLVMLAVLQKNYMAFLLLSGVACMVRVTAFMALAPVFVRHVYMELRRRGTVRGLAHCALSSIVAVVIILAAMMSIDYIFYGYWILTPYKFLEFNIIKNVSRYFGVHPWWWYFVAGFPVAVGPHIGFLALFPSTLNAVAKKKGRDKRNGGRARALLLQLAGLLVWTMSLHSMVGHKEVRFLFPMVPVAVVLISFVLSSFVRMPAATQRISLRGHRRLSTFLGPFLVTPARVLTLNGLFVCINVLMFLFLGFVYRQGGPNVVAALRSAPQPYFGRVDVMTHCYFTPGYSQVHGKVGELRLIDCPVTLDDTTGERITTLDMLLREYPKEFIYWHYERKLPADLPADVASTAAFQQWLALMEDRLPQSQRNALTLPDAIVVFAFISEARRDDFFLPHGYTLQSHLFHAPKSFEGDEDSYVDIWVKNSSA